MTSKTPDNTPPKGIAPDSTSSFNKKTADGTNDAATYGNAKANTSKADRGTVPEVGQPGSDA